MSSGSVAEPLPAATLLLLRDHQDQLQVFMQQRAHEASFVGGAYVFPGGKADPEDYGFPEHFLKFPDNEHSSILFQKDNAQALAITALRECFEEAGILLAYQEQGELLSIHEGDFDKWKRMRDALNESRIDLMRICSEENLSLALDQLVFLGHWVTPASSPQRFDTLFFACHMPEGQEGGHDDYESIDSLWLAPDEALQRFNEGEIKLIYPTLRSLQYLKEFKTANEFMDYQKKGLTILGRDMDLGQDDLTSLM